MNIFERHVVALEDKRYFRHLGFDYISIARELFKIITFRRHGGASTIDMQFVRTTTGRYQRTFGRKVREIFLSWLIQYHFHKVAILKSYLAVAFFGSGLIGAERAALAVFGKSTSTLSSYEAAFLASMLVYPKPLNPDEAWQVKVSRRANYALKITPTLEEMFDKVQPVEFGDI